VNAKNRISIGVSAENAGRIVPHDELPVLAPVGCIYHERMMEAGVSHGDDRISRIIDSTRNGAIAQRSNAGCVSAG
jgi:hypothetical protein